MLKYLNLKIVFKDEYDELKEEWEKQNKEIDRLTCERNKLNKKIIELEIINNAFAQTIEKQALELQEKKKRTRKKVK